MGKILIGFVLIASISAFAKEKNCKIYVVDKVLMNEVSNKMQDVLVAKGYELTRDETEGIFNVYSHAKMSQYYNDVITYTGIYGTVEGEAVSSIFTENFIHPLTMLTDGIGDFIMRDDSSFNLIKTCDEFYNSVRHGVPLNEKVLID